MPTAPCWRRSAPTTTAGSPRSEDNWAKGIYRIGFDTGGYFAAAGIATFYPEVTVAFEITDAAAHHHVPLLLSPYSYSTYRGS